MLQVALQGKGLLSVSPSSLAERARGWVKWVDFSAKSPVNVPLNADLVGFAYIW